MHSKNILLRKQFDLKHRIFLAAPYQLNIQDLARKLLYLFRWLTFEEAENFAKRSSVINFDLSSFETNANCIFRREKLKILIKVKSTFFYLYTGRINFYINKVFVEHFLLTAKLKLEILFILEEP